MVANLTESGQDVDVAALPAAPKNPLGYRKRLRAVRLFHVGYEALRDAGGPVTRVVLGPKWLVPSLIVVTSPRGIRDVLGRSDAFVEKNIMATEMRHLLGGNLFNLAHEQWLPRRRSIQPVFTKRHVRTFGADMSQAAETIAASWAPDGDIDLDAQCRRLTLRALGRSVLGLDLDERAESLAEPLQITLKYIADRALAPVRAPRWLPTPARRRARAATAMLRQLADEVLQACRADPTRDAPLVHALIGATDPATGQTLSDEEICSELISFMNAGHDTTATTLTYALWALGHHPQLQDRVVAEIRELGDRELTPDDVPRLEYTVAVLHEALRLCPPAAALGRVAMQDIEVDGYRVEKGATLVAGIYAVQRDSSLWDEPLQFNPDRFSPANAKARDRWQYLPFGAGPRSCIGDHFAMLEATLALATIIRRREIRSLEGDFPLATPFTTVAAQPIPARVRARAAEGVIEKRE
jgi:cytochrome P450